MLGHNVGHYKLIDILGEGGMGVVYRALDLKLERYVAVKILNSQSVKNPQFVERFKREAKHQAKLNHPNIVPVYGFVDEDGVLGIVMEFIEGETLSSRINRLGNIDLIDALELLAQILKGADYAHSKGFIHRDLKPSNIIINDEGVAKIMDFGISKSLKEPKGITRTGVKIGTILYMSPEQIKANEPTQQSDIYAIGILFYEMLKGKNPFDFKTEFEIMEAHLKKNLPKITSTTEFVPSEIDKIIAKATQKTSDKRYKNCKEFLEDVEDILSKLKNYNAKITGESKEKILSEKKSAKLKLIGYAVLILIVFITIFFFLFNQLSDYWKEIENQQSTEISKEIKNTESISLLNANWNLIKIPTQNSLNAIKFIDNKIGVVCGLSGTIIRTTDAGKTWNNINFNRDINLFDVDFTNNDIGFIAGENGTLFRSEDRGITWEEINIPVQQSLFDINFIKGTENGFIVGGKGNILRTSDGGKNWSIINSPTDKLLYAVYFVNDKIGFIAGWDGVVLKSVDGGNYWKEIESLTDKYLRKISFINKKTGFIVGGGGEIFRTEDLGENWEKIKSGTYSGLYAVKFFNENEGIILGSKGEILITTDRGNTWNEKYAGRFVSLTDLTNINNNVIIIGYNGTILSN